MDVVLDNQHAVDVDSMVQLMFDDCLMPDDDVFFKMLDKETQEQFPDSKVCEASVATGTDCQRMMDDVDSLEQLLTLESLLSDIDFTPVARFRNEQQQCSDSQIGQSSVATRTDPNLECSKIMVKVESLKQFNLESLLSDADFASFGQIRNDQYEFAERQVDRSSFGCPRVTEMILAQPIHLTQGAEPKPKKAIIIKRLPKKSQKTAVQPSKNTIETDSELKQLRQCGICQMQFQHLGNMTAHMRTHTGDKPFVCTVCKKAFAVKANLSTHMRIHTGERPYVCRTCDESFSQISTLRSHMLIHTGERPHVCSECSRGFTKSSDLTRHMRTHTSERPFKCRHCAKTFAQSYSVTLHERCHTGEKPCTCLVCHKTFAQPSGLNAHMKLHSTESNVRV